MIRNVMKRRVAVLAGVGLAALAGATALANAPGHFGPGHMKQMVTARIVGALDAAKASPAQRASVGQARDRVFAAFEEERVDPREHMALALSLFEQDKVDTQQIAQLRAQQEQKREKIGDAIVDAIHQSHDALTQPQRKAVADYLRAEHQSSWMAKQGQGFMKRMAASKIDAALDAAKATPEQRKAIEAARDRVFAACERGDKGEKLDEALALFVADGWDAQKIAQLRAEHQAEAKKLGDAIEQALVEAHDVLSAPQRKAIVEFVKAEHAKHAREWQQQK